MDPRTTPWVRWLRLTGGFVLFAFLALHLINHALGLISLEALDEGARWFKLLWRNPMAWLLVPLAATIHPLLALWSFASRSTLKGLRPAEVLQLCLGLCVPPLIVVHIFATRGLNTAFGVNDSYAFVLNAIWVYEPAKGLLQSIALLIAWTHGCIGIHFWLRLKSFYPRLKQSLFALAILLPTLALAGFAQAGRDVERLMQDKAWREMFFAKAGLPPGNTGPEWVSNQSDLALAIMAGLLATLLAWRLLRGLLEQRQSFVSLEYPGKRQVKIRSGVITVLEASRSNGIPHASVCGGRGRCSTCRVRVEGAGVAKLPPPDEAEQKVLRRVGAPEGVRLACQIRPTAALAVTPLLPAGTGPDTINRKTTRHEGSEQEIAILFADLRGFTRLAEHKLPYDTVFLLNRYFQVMGEAIEQAGGHVDKFIGDGIMALFGIDQSAAKGCRDALVAARNMGIALERLNEELRHEMGQAGRLRMGIGIHCGQVIVGDMGHGRAVSLTAIGDAVNTASRLESATKELGVELAFSRIVAEKAERSSRDGLKSHRIEVRGRTEPLDILTLERAAQLPEAIRSPEILPS